MLKILGSTILLLQIRSFAAAQTFSSQEEVIKKPGPNYIENWYSGDAARTESALRPELAKRMVRTDPIIGKSIFIQIGAMTLVQNTRAGYGRQVPKEQQQKDITTLDRFNNTAAVKIVASTWIDCLEGTKYDGGGRSSTCSARCVAVLYIDRERPRVYGIAPIRSQFVTSMCPLEEL
jgi:hypothetical protein